MSAYEQAQLRLRAAPRTWLVTGAAGFIGSNLLEALLRLDQHVVGLDNFATGHQRNLDEVRGLLPAAQWARFRFLRGDIRVLEDCRAACEGVDYVLHQAALGSVPRSLLDPIATNASNVDGFLNLLVAARDAGVQRFVYAASSSTYGDHPGLPKVEHVIGRPLSPYAVTKYVNELYADVFTRCYGLPTVGLRYFNVFGPRQDPAGAYAAVIPKWIASMLKAEPVQINGTGETSRDFCYIANVVQANVLAADQGHAGPGATDESDGGVAEVYNVAVGARTSLNGLFDLLRQALAEHAVSYDVPPVYGDFRAGDVRHSQADIAKAARQLGYAPEFTLQTGLEAAMPWYVEFLRGEP